MGDKDYLLGDRGRAHPKGKGIALKDPKIAFVRKYTKNKRVLDLGCVQHNPNNHSNPYWLHKAIADNALSVIGLDLYEEGVEVLKRRGYHVIHGDAEQFNLGEKFEVIVAGDLIEHLSNPGRMLWCVSRHLEESGRFVIVTPNPWYWRFTLKALFLGRAGPNPEHTCWFCLQTLTHLLSRYGMAVVESEYATVQYGYRWRRLFDLVMPLPRLLKYNSIHVYAAPVKTKSSF
ncbi:class I SAM-dependent methyltransferase [Thiorhodovibrio litoralis]|uniref:class I SAM-dependent methyltransferase n=1 Tax=Thiorhodovibrio litoralis TaxID=2952932 RepID=UPI002B26291B|nr:class I SAM-dependent methyltransferase [Thiorhodovibrio litoralis]WPL11553.1 Methyltransferase domain protein [Thiorhodovibrio litoralis]